MRELLWRLVRSFLFRLDAEAAHRLTVRAIRLGIRLRGAPLLMISGSGRAALPPPDRRPEVFGLRFRSRIGLAAGFDKDAEILEGLPALGFGFAEIGTVTPRPQPGNDRPRLFRDPATRRVFNRMGFNGLGAELVSRRLAAARPRLPEGFRVGVNLGKNKETPLEQAGEDYARAARAFEGLADYLVINVSSPNTPGLRSLQTAEALRPIVGQVQDVIAGWRSAPPLLLKLAPEVRGDELAALIDAGEAMGVAGWVLTNTLSGQWRLGAGSLPGGWSGSGLTEASLATLREARRRTRKPIISVGGIMSPEDAVARVRAGAELVQVYSGWIFGGPIFPRKIAAKLTESENSRP